MINGDLEAFLFPRNASECGISPECRRWKRKPRYRRDDPGLDASARDELSEAVLHKNAVQWEARIGIQSCESNDAHEGEYVKAAGGDL